MTEDLPNPALLPAGFSDLLPPDAAREASLVEAMMAAFALHGYQRVKPPLLEFEDSLLTGSGAAVADQTFRLMDPVSQRMMGLRADTTPQVARIAATRLVAEARPLRLCYAGPVLRVRGTQLAPERQLPQAGIELIGSDAIEADAEVAIVAVEALAAIGVAPVSLDVTLPSLTPILLDAAAISPTLRASLSRALDRKDSAAVEAAVRESAAPVLHALPALMAASGPAEAALAALRVADLPPAARTLSDNAAAILAAIARRAPGLRITLDPVEFRGFRYHTGVAFTLYGPGLGGELARGGRYVSHNGEPATGMTLYPDAVLRAAPRAAEPARLFIPLGADGAAFRAQGFITVAALSAEDTPERLGCTHMLQDGRAVPLPRKG
ncbi:MAG: hypothetical protein RIS83_56 [Pseudomonadota bacterium]